jgi:hypothetical protein
MRSPRQLRHISLLATGISVFLGLAILRKLLGVLRYVEVPWMFGAGVDGSVDSLGCLFAHLNICEHLSARSE